MVLTGALVGFLVGASKSPLASAALPIIAALLTAAAAYLFSTEKGERPAKPYKVAGTGFICLLSGFVPAFIIGILLRLGPVEHLAIGPWVVDWGDPSPYSELNTIESRRKYLILNSYLAALGVDTFHRRAYLKDVVDATSLTAANLQAFLNDKTKTRSVSSTLDTLSKCEQLGDKDRLFVGVSRVVWQNLASDIADPENPVPPTCDVSCKAALLSLSLHYWNPTVLLNDKASECGIQPADLLRLNEAISVSLSPLDQAYLNVRTDSKLFFDIWSEPSGEFTGTSDITSIIDAPTLEND